MKKNIPQRVHFVGIGGIGMSALAQHLFFNGHTVTGSDRQANEQTAKLQGMGVKVFVGHDAHNVGDAQLVVKTSAVSSNCEIDYATQHNIPVLLREELLGQIFDGFKTRIAVCGTHGKTTVTAMLHHVLERCGVSHAAFIGGDYKGQNYFDGRRVVVAEACEYNKSFLHLHPTLCVCLNIEYDHPDCYANLPAVEKAFSQLFDQSEKVIVNSRNKTMCPNAELFGEEGFTAQNLSQKDGCFSFDACLDGTVVCRVELSVCGRHNVQNALATMSAAKQVGLPMLQVAQALHTFCGVDRRWTKVPARLNVVCDYAHHPTEIAAAVSTAKSISKGRVVCVFQPHTYSRTKAFWQQFVSCFKGTRVVYLPVYSAREQPQENVTSHKLFLLAKAQGLDAAYFATFQQAADYLLSTTDADDLVLLVGAGDVNRLAELLK